MYAQMTNVRPHSSHMHPLPCSPYIYTSRGAHACLDEYPGAHAHDSMHDACISNTHSSLHRVPPSCPSIASTPHAHLQTWQQLQAVRTQLATKKQQLATFQQHQASSIAAGLHVVSMPPVHPVWCILPLYVTSHLDTFRLVGGWVGGYVRVPLASLPSASLSLARPLTPLVSCRTTCTSRRKLPSMPSSWPSRRPTLSSRPPRQATPHGMPPHHTLWSCVRVRAGAVYRHVLHAT